MKNNLSYYVGQFIGIVLSACLAACLGGAVVALTLKFLMWIF